MMKNMLQVSGNMLTISVFNVNYPRTPFSSMYDKFTCIHVHYVYDYLFSSMQTVEQILEMLLVYINCCFNEQIVFKSKWYLKIVLTWKLCNVTTFYEHKMYPQGRQLLHIKISKKILNSYLSFKDSIYMYIRTNNGKHITYSGFTDCQYMYTIHTFVISYVTCYKLYHLKKLIIYQVV